MNGREQGNRSKPGQKCPSHFPATDLEQRFVMVVCPPSYWLDLGQGERRKWISRGKGGRHLLCEAPEGPSRQKVPATFSPKR